MDRCDRVIQRIEGVFEGESHELMVMSVMQTHIHSLVTAREYYEDQQAIGDEDSVPN